MSGGDDNSDAVKHECGHLIAYRLPGARGHDAENIAPAEQAVRYSVLPLAERIVAEIFF